jgi:hypothetical protein
MHIDGWVIVSVCSILGICYLVRFGWPILIRAKNGAGEIEFQTGPEIAKLPSAEKHDDAKRIGLSGPRSESYPKT